MQPFFKELDGWVFKSSDDNWGILKGEKYFMDIYCKHLILHS